MNSIGKLFSTIGGTFVPQVQSGLDDLTTAFQIIIGELALIIAVLTLGFFLPRRK